MGTICSTLRSQKVPLIHLNKWGPAAWHFFHTITFAYNLKPSEEEKAKIKEFFEKTVPDILPCANCSAHYRELIAKNPVRPENRESLSKWLIDLHNQVNDSLGKPRMSYEQVYQLYLPSDKTTKDLKKDKVELILWGLLIVLVISFIIWICKFRAFI